MPWVASRTSSSSIEWPAARACRTATAGHRTTSPSSAGPGSGSSGREVSSSSMGKARTSVGPFSPIQRSCRLLMYSTSTHSTDSSAIGLTCISPSTNRQMPAISDSSTAISDSLATSTGTSAPLAARSGRPHRGAGARTGGGGLPGGVPALVGVDDVAHEPVPDDVRTGEGGEVHVLDVAQDLAHDPQAALRPAGQVDLGDVTGDDDPRPESQPGEEHLHLFGGGVLRLVEDHERIVEGVVSDEEVVG